MLRAIQYNLLRIAGSIPVGLSKWLTFWRCCAMDWIISRPALDKSDYWANRFGGPLDIMEREVYGIPDFREFEGHKLPVPRKWETYLLRKYGNFMELPPVEERNGHSPLVVDLH